MSNGELTLYRIGQVPDLTLWEDAVAFGIDCESLDPPTARPECVAAREALARTRAALAAATQISALRAMELAGIVARISECTASVAEAARLAAESASPQSAPLAEASGQAAAAAALARELPGMLKVYHHSANKRWHEAQIAEAAGRVVSLLQASVDRLEPALAALAIERVGFAVRPSPKGPLSFDAVTGILEYRRDPSDVAPLELRFGARVGGRPVTQVATLTTLPAAPADPRDIADQRIERDLFETQLESRYAGRDDKELVWTGLDLTLDPALFASRFERIQVNGHIVRVRGALSSQAGALDLSIRARYVVFEPGASLDVSGRRGEDRSDTADGGRRPGENGQHGAQGNPGQPGGRIDIVAERILGTPRLLAHGAPGGRGQNGGKGAQGPQGGPGAPDVVEDRYGGRKIMHIVTAHGTAGQPGGKGGKGGRAGQRGAPGRGGTISVRTVLPCLQADLQARPGQDFLTAADAEAHPGQGGEPGAGGPGGSKYTGTNFWDMPTYGVYPPGAPGPAGDRGDDAPPADAAAPGVLERGTIGLTEFGAALAGTGPHATYGSADGTLLAMVLFAAERLYLNAESARDIEALRDVLDYLLRVTANPSPGPMQARLQAIQVRSLSLRDSLVRGLDYFGRTPDFVPSLSLEETRVYYERALQVARDLESDYEAFWKKQADGAQRRSSLSAQLRRADDVVDKELRPKLERLQAAAGELTASIDSLTQQAIEREATMNVQLEAFKAELLNKQAFDTVTGVLHMAWSLVLLGINGKSLFSGGVAALVAVAGRAGAGDHDQGDAGGAGGSGTEGLVEAFGKVKGNLEAILADYRQHCHADAWRSDALKIVPETLDKAAFDQQVDALIDVPGAAELKATVHDYLDIVAQRNKAIVEHDSVLQQARGVRAQIAMVGAETADLERQKQVDDDPQRAVFVQFMAGSLQLAKSFLVETLYLMARATDYHTLSRAPLRLADYRVATLEKQYGETQHRLLEAMLETGARTDVLGTCRIEDAARLERLKRHEPVWLLLPVNTRQPPRPPFANVERPMVDRVQCFLEGVTGRGRHAYATVAIEHCGVCYVWSETSRSLWSFAHEPVTTSFQYWLSAEDKEIAGGGPDAHRSGDLTEGGKFMRVSPYAVWGIRLRREDGMNAELDFSGLQRVELRLWGKGKVDVLSGLAAADAAA